MREGGQEIRGEWEEEERAGIWRDTNTICYNVG